MSVVELQQTLHGYSRGHRQISGSLELGGVSRRSLDTISDVSGSVVGAARNVFPYLTGYPLPETQYYVLAKTWLARDAERPGTVWTHSLLIPFPRLAKLNSLAPLEEVFREPVGVPEKAAYAKPLMVTIREQKQQTKIPGSSENLLRALYAYSEEAVLVLEQHPKTLSQLIFAIWSQQWPRLRRSFSFCTGSLDLRTLDSKLFDLQVMHPSLFTPRQGVVTVTFGGGQVASFNKTGSRDSWSKILHQDLQLESSQLRTFLHRFGAEFSARSSMVLPCQPFRAAQQLAEPQRTQKVGSSSCERANAQ